MEFGASLDMTNPASSMRVLNLSGHRVRLAAALQGRRSILNDVAYLVDDLQSASQKLEG